MVPLTLLPDDRVFKKAEELGQNANYFVNQCIEGILDAMDADDISHDIPVLKLDRIMKGKTMLDSKWVNALCAFIVPNVDVEEARVVIRQDRG